MKVSVSLTADDLKYLDDKVQSGVFFYTFGRTPLGGGSDAAA